MPEIVDNASSVTDGEPETLPPTIDDRDAFALERRLFRAMCWTVALMVAAGLLFAPWRVTAGLATGGLLSLLNHRWLRVAVMAAFDPRTIARRGRPRIGIARYILRYIVIALVLYIAARLNLISIVAALLGLCSFVVALMLEGLMQIYFIIIHREES